MKLHFNLLLLSFFLADYNLVASVSGKKRSRSPQESIEISTPENSTPAIISEEEASPKRHRAETTEKNGTYTTQISIKIDSELERKIENIIAENVRLSGEVNGLKKYCELMTLYMFKQYQQTTEQTNKINRLKKNHTQQNNNITNKLDDHSSILALLDRRQEAVENKLDDLSDISTQIQKRQERTEDELIFKSYATFVNDAGSSNLSSDQDDLIDLKP